MVAKAAIDGRSGILTLRTAANPVDPKVYEPWEMTERERELTTKCVKLIQGRIPTKVSFIRNEYFIDFTNTTATLFILNISF